MKWVTRKRIHVNRTATGWLIRRFLDPGAEILFERQQPSQGEIGGGRSGRAFGSSSRPSRGNLER